MRRGQDRRRVPECHTCHPETLDRLKTALADRYAIEEELGAGVRL